MRAEYPLAPLGDSSIIPAESHGIQLMPGIAPDPEWDNARMLLARGRTTARLLAAEVERLRDNYVQAGIVQRSKHLMKGSSKITNVIYGENEESKGFQARLREQLGLHPEQARRILQEAEYQRRIETVAEMEDGDVIEVPGKSAKDGKAEPVPVEVTPRMIALAQQARETLGMPAAPKACRLWAGIAGEGARVDKIGNGSAARQAPDDLELFIKATKTIARCGRAWDRCFDAGDKARAIAELGDALKVLPDNVLEAVVDAVTGGRR